MTAIACFRSGLYLGVQEVQEVEGTTRTFQRADPSASGLEYSTANGATSDGAVSDVNGDGHMDVLITGRRGYWKLFVGAGDATFTELKGTPLNQQSMGSNSVFFTKADFDSDGRFDFFIFSGESGPAATEGSTIYMAAGGQSVGPLREVFAQPAQDNNACNKPTDRIKYGIFSDCSCSCFGYWYNTVMGDLNVRSSLFYGVL